MSGSDKRRPVGQTSLTGWSEIRLIVHRPVTERATWAILVRRPQGTSNRDQLVARGEFPAPLGSDARDDWSRALTEALRSLNFIKYATPAEPSAPPGGPRGDAVDGVSR